MTLAVSPGFAVRSLFAGTVGFLLASQPAQSASALLAFDSRPEWLIAITNPDAAFVLLIVGIYALLVEFTHPGAVIPAVIGLACLALAALALSALPVQYGALALLITGIALMAAEAFTPGFGVLGLLGFAGFIGGGYFLFDAPAGSSEMHVSLPLIAGSAVASAGLIFLVIGAAAKARRRPTVTGAEEMLAARGTVIDWSGDSGRIRIRGEVWAARGNAAFRPGDNVKVASRDGLTLTVEPE
jgi:membrane-bound serine protease (ClpP class)